MIQNVEDFDARLAADPNNGVLLWTGLAELLLSHPRDFLDFEIVRSLIVWCRQDSITRMALEWVTSWAEHGRPQIEVGEKLAASLALTRVPAEVAASTPLPYPAFLVRIPDGLLTADGAQLRAGEREDAIVDLSIAMVRQTSQDQLTVIFASRRSATLWMRVSADFGDVFGKDPTPDLPASWDGMVFENSSQDKRAIQLGLQLVFGTLLELLARGGAKPSPGIAKVGAAKGKKDAPQVPRPINVRILREVRSDVRQAVREFVSHGTSAPMVRTLVRGHWKHQPVGPQRQDRKLIQVEPYWRGPEDGPVVVRPIKVE